jgi:hypothetical protein
MKLADKDLNSTHCAEAARSFGKALHSRQDRSAHRSWPGGGDWSQFIAHPGWWDSWDDNDLRRMYNGVPFPLNPNAYPSEEFWRNYHRANLVGFTHDTWEEQTGHPETWAQKSPIQYGSQQAQRSLVIVETKAAIADFGLSIRGTCFCRSVMLLSP